MPDDLKVPTLIIAMVDQNFDAIRSRAMRDFKIQAAQAGKQSNRCAGITFRMMS
jgi:hypothetical protein